MRRMERMEKRTMEMKLQTRKRRRVMIWQQMRTPPDAEATDFADNVDGDGY